MAEVLLFHHAQRVGFGALVDRGLPTHDERASGLPAERVPAFLAAG